MSEHFDETTNGNSCCGENDCPQCDSPLPLCGFLPDDTLGGKKDFEKGEEVVYFAPTSKNKSYNNRIVTKLHKEGFLDVIVDKDKEDDIDIRASFNSALMSLDEDSVEGESVFDSVIRQMVYSNNVVFYQEDMFSLKELQFLLNYAFLSFFRIGFYSKSEKSYAPVGHFLSHAEIITAKAKVDKALVPVDSSSKIVLFAEDRTGSQVDYFLENHPDVLDFQEYGVHDLEDAVARACVAPDKNGIFLVRTLEELLLPENIYWLQQLWLHGVRVAFFESSTVFNSYFLEAKRCYESFVVDDITVLSPYGLSRLVDVMREHQKISYALDCHIISCDLREGVEHDDSADTTGNDEDVEKMTIRVPEKLYRVIDFIYTNACKDQDDMRNDFHYLKKAYYEPFKERVCDEIVNTVNRLKK